MNRRRSAAGIGGIALFTALVALMLAAAGLTGSAAGGTAAGGVQSVSVQLGDLFIKPTHIMGAAGSTVLHIVNGGSVQHDVAVEGTSVQTPMIDSRRIVDLDVRSLPAGTYTIKCLVPGHASAGMTATLMLTGAGDGSSGGGARPMGQAGQAATPTTMSSADMEAAMTARTKAFPAKTEGTGAVPLAATTLSDGTKEFDLTASVVPWETEPGHKVEAWAYNGIVPGPTIHVAVGDRVRIVLNNRLPEPTVIHFHGVHVPNAMDGVPDITQPAVEPGASFTYEFTAKDPAVGMYHSHFDAAKQVTNGLLGAFIIGDLPVPSGVTVSQELPMILNDAGTIGFSINGKSFPATAPVVAEQGDWLLVHYMNEGLQPHPMHLHGIDQVVIAKDGFPLTPYTADTILVGPGERYSVLVHATEPGVWAWHCHILTHAEREDGMFGMVTALIVQ